jgi:hypothetical protein
VRRPVNAVVISHEKEATQRLFKAVKDFIIHSEVKPRVSIDSKSEMKFPETDSSYFIGTAGARAFGRGDTVHRAHLSEAAFYLEFNRIINGIGEACEYGQIDIETTANGRGEFYDFYQLAKNGKSSYTAHFVPWFIDDEYSVDNMTEDERNGLSEAVRQMISIPDQEFKLTDEEKLLMRRAMAEWKIKLTIGQIKWRRYKIWDKADFFWQEYPEDDVTCFLQSGRPVFKIIKCDPTLKIPLDSLPLWAASKEKKEALLKRRLFGGVDGAEGTLSGDAHSFAVIDAPPTEAVAKVIYEYTSNEPIDVFCRHVAKICKRYNIVLGVEKNGVGVAHVQRLRQLGIRFSEYETTSANRPIMITDLEEAYRKGTLIESYPEAENEARDMEYKDNNRAEHKKGKHDDRIFARAIAWQMRHAPTAKVTVI